jgi:hypothetical protein
VPPEKLPHSALLARLAQVALSWGSGRTNGSTAAWPRLAALNRAAHVLALIYRGFVRKAATLSWIPPSKVELRAGHAGGFAGKLCFIYLGATIRYRERGGNYGRS